MPPAGSAAIRFKCRTADMRVRDLIITLLRDCDLNDMVTVLGATEGECYIAEAHSVKRRLGARPENRADDSDDPVDTAFISDW